MLYGIGGAEGLRMFYNEEYVKRYPGMSQNLEDAAWKHEVSVCFKNAGQACDMHASGRDMAVRLIPSSRQEAAGRLGHLKTCMQFGAAPCPRPYMSGGS